MRLITALAALAVLLTAIPADARRGTQPTSKRYDGRWARHKVIKYHAARKMPKPVRVTKVRTSLRGRSSQVAAVTPGGKVHLYNVSHKRGIVRATKTGLTRQSTRPGARPT